MKWKYRYKAARSGEIFYKRLEQLTGNRILKRMKNIPQHRGNNTFDHSVNVVKVSFYMACRLGLKIDCISMATGAMLHDFYLYDTEKMPFTDWKHSMYHPRLSIINALEHFYLNKMERNIVLSHMWPIPLAKMPRSREAVIVIMADNFCSLLEIVFKKRIIDPPIHKVLKGTQYPSDKGHKEISNEI